MTDAAEEVAGSGDDIGGVIETADSCVKFGVGGECVGDYSADICGPGSEFVGGVG